MHVIQWCNKQKPWDGICLALQKMRRKSMAHALATLAKEAEGESFIYLFLIEEEGESMCMESVLAHLLNLLWCFRNKQHLPHLKKILKIVYKVNILLQF